MTTIRKFEDLEIWQNAREICKGVHQLCQHKDVKKDFALSNQMNRSSGSIMDNIAEGFERNGNREFIQYLSIAKASCGELRSQLYRARDKGYLEIENAEKFNSKCVQLSKKISSLIKYLSNSSYRGTKYLKNQP